MIYACTWPIDLAVAAQSRGLLPFAIPPVLGIVVGYGIVAGSILATWITAGWHGVVELLKRFGIWRVGVRWYVVAFLGVPVVYLAALAFTTAVTGHAPDFSSPAVTRFVPAGLSFAIVVPGWFLYEVLTNGEEIGWRGYLLPRLEARYGALVATMAVATIWAAWHAPKFLVVPPPYDYPLWIWGLNLLAEAVLLTWLFQHTRGSLLLVTLFHASTNTAALTLPILPASSDDTARFATAVALLALCAVVVLVFDRRLWSGGGRIAARAVA